MNTVEDFVTLLRDDLGLPFTTADVDLRFDELSAWDSMQMLQLLSLLEQRTGRSMPLAEALDATSLRAIYTLASR